ncbi:restriction endonuclease subunit S [uncultured Brachyspira sp.]|uniref:restriction endonuclease subunit S n=1 Tax=uncultured Brachyspira sp. TaxID=221953 RepID=UPI0026158105|nr:restriction endonuclease subunit S [uncultured Brachyspira sp.]
MTASELKKSILQMAVEGKLTEQSKKDEPVEKLLKRIKEEKDSLIKEGKIKKEKRISEIYKKDGSYYERVSDGKNILKDACIDEELPFEIPDTWTWCRIGNIGTIIRGNGIKRSDVVESGFPCVRYGEIYTTYNISFKEAVSNIPEEIFKKSKHFSYGDVLMTLTGENKEDIAKAVVYLGDSKVAASGDLAFWTNHKMEPLFISYLMNSPYAIYCKSKLATGDIIVHISASKLESILIPIPPIEEQKRIVEKINFLMPLINEYDELEKSITKLNKEFPDNIKKSILQYAIEGKLTEQSQEDEPVEELLKRIKEEREKLIKEGKIKKDKTTSEIYKKDGSYYERVFEGNNIVKDVCIDDELPFEIPDSWVWVRLYKLIYLISGTSYNKNDITNNGVRILRGGNIQDNQLLLFDDDVFLPISYYDEEKNIKKYDIIIVASTGSKTVIGKPAFIKDNYNNIQIGAFLRIIRLYDINISSYINTIFESNYYREHIRNKVTGTNINNIKSDYIENLLIPLPPIEEQKRIVDKINKLNEVINTIKI